VSAPVLCTVGVVVMFYIESHWIPQNTWKPIVCCLFSGSGINAFRMASNNSSPAEKSCACAYITFLAGIFSCYATVHNIWQQKTQTSINFCEVKKSYCNSYRLWGEGSIHDGFLLFTNIQHYSWFRLTAPWAQYVSEQPFYSSLIISRVSQDIPATGLSQAVFSTQLKTAFCSSLSR
jgi:hypothetical protein